MLHCRFAMTVLILPKLKRAARVIVENIQNEGSILFADPKVGAATWR
jgi:hypothetical protein